MKRLGKQLLAYSLVVGGLMSCQKQEEEIQKKKVKYEGPMLETTNVLTLMSDSAQLRLRLKAPLEQIFENGDQVYPKGVNLTFLAKDGSTVVNTIKGNYGKLDKTKNLYIVRGDVQVTNVEKQQRMNTEEAFYDKNRALIYTEKETEVRVTTPTERLTGRGLTANQDFSRYTIMTPTGVFAVDPTATAPATKAPESNR
ncbi:LPS export ABC transporter periplasmic protein LptC [Hymenobacter taeanensis]|uniref:LPS export ABC transporter periplasmic protein LptC n=1 Tax=Hymenobacter taeanensis TaxID=2735321 RepID=A0A6M6BIE3_9BACT|nr:MULTISPECIES: LPS export ABC transporter periplasmic protein LptC [Hymenobacter]QJX46825.1 LPS export ABC transporter periplasmic protein LptC [Hymenobacter taeanensis]UOQ80695.1 LPS export ABC transporter periplasmic protein LptC [Hymenobacter sp. 5414T-23]